MRKSKSPLRKILDTILKKITSFLFVEKPRVKRSSPRVRPLKRNKPTQRAKKAKIDQSVKKSSHSRIRKKEQVKKKVLIKGPVKKKEYFSSRKKQTFRPGKSIDKEFIISDGKLAGEITHYFSKIKVVVVNMTEGSIRVGDKIRIKGNNETGFTQEVGSLQIESVDVKVAPRGKLVGLKVIKEPKVGDKVYIL